ncbi:MAG: hypothetical protein ACFHXK_13935 [bacterium]
MDNKELEAILKDRFQTLRHPAGDPKLVADIMAQVSTLEQAPAATPRAETEIALPAAGITLHWVLLLALLLGGGIFLFSLQSLPVERLLEHLQLTLPGGYSEMVSVLILPLLAVLGSLPVAWLMLED